MSKNPPVPKPLFDTLEYLPKELEQNTSQQYAYPKDFACALQFIRSYRGSIATFNSYRRELERLLQWSWNIVHKSICTLNRQDIEEYIEFCINPPSYWISVKKCERFTNQDGIRVPNENWRPFVATISKSAYRAGNQADIKNYALSQKALQAIFAILGSFYNYLIQEDVIGYNPVAQIRQKSKYLRKQQGQAPIRRLSELQWGYVIETAALMAQSNPEDHERTLFIMSALYGMYLRISELASNDRWQPLMEHFYRDLDGNWWFKTVGKGNKERSISVSNAMLDALKRYRQFQGLSPLPHVGDITPILCKQKGKGAITSTRHIRMIVQRCFDATIVRLQKDGFKEEAQQLTAATVHWLRHTGISDDVKHRPREHVRDDAGHGSSAITDKYIDIERRERHASARKKSINQN